jgi:hypothetical protein
MLKTDEDLCHSEERLSDMFEAYLCFSIKPLTDHVTFIYRDYLHKINLNIFKIIASSS